MKNRNRAYVLLLSLYFLLLLSAASFLLLDQVEEDLNARNYEDESLWIKYESENTLYKAMEEVKRHLNFKNKEKIILFDNEGVESADLDPARLKKEGIFVLHTSNTRDGERLNRNVFFRKYLDIFYKDPVDIGDEDIDGLIDLFVSSELTKLQENGPIKLNGIKGTRLFYEDIGEDVSGPIEGEEEGPDNGVSGEEDLEEDSETGLDLDGEDTEESPREDTQEDEKPSNEIDQEEKPKEKIYSTDDFVLLPNFRIDRSTSIKNLNGLVIIDENTELEGSLEMKGVLIVKGLPKGFSSSKLRVKEGIVIAKSSDFKKIKSGEKDYDRLVKYENIIDIVDIKAFKSAIYMD